VRVGLEATGYARWFERRLTELGIEVWIGIAHGADTMVQSGLYLERALPGLLLPIVMTGAMTPLGFEDSDGLQNLTESLLAVRLVAPGQILPIGRARKDRALGRFVWTEGHSS
jgi:hypothetical protein